MQPMIPPTIRGAAIVGNQVPQVDNIDLAFQRLIAWHAVDAPTPFHTWLLYAGLGIGKVTAARGVQKTLDEFGLLQLTPETAATMVGTGPSGLAARQAHLTAQFPNPPAGYAAMPKKLIACYLVGTFNELVGGNINAWLAENCFSGNARYAANNLKGPGRQVGHFFGLLDGDDMPTTFFATFY